MGDEIPNQVSMKYTQAPILAHVDRCRCIIIQHGESSVS